MSRYQNQYDIPPTDPLPVESIVEEGIDGLDLPGEPHLRVQGGRRQRVADAYTSVTDALYINCTL